jgi:hypothetical protein
MPLILGTTITTAIQDAALRNILTVTGAEFRDSMYPVSNVYVSTDASTWTAATSITSWSDTQIVAVFSLTAGVPYYVKVVTSDTEEAQTSSVLVVGARLTRIAYDIYKAITEITAANGYAITWGSVNQPDMALQTFPSADITYSSEDATEEFNLGHLGFAVAEFVIRIRCKLSTTDAIPTHTIDAVYDIALHSLRRRMRALNLSGSLGLMMGHEAQIVYKRMERENHVAGDRFIPGDMLTFWNVQYYDRDN